MQTPYFIVQYFNYLSRLFCLLAATASAAVFSQHSIILAKQYHDRKNTFDIGPHGADLSS